MVQLSCRTVQDKAALLSQRSKEAQVITHVVDGAIRENEVDAVVAGCGGGGACPAMARTLSRLFGVRQRSSRKQLSDALREASSVGSAGNKNKLQLATQKMQGKLLELESRSDAARRDAYAFQKAGNRASALRSLKRAKIIEKQVATLQNAVDSLEVQSDVLEQTQLQREVAVALGQTASSLKRDQKLLKKAEAAVDASQEMRDLAENLTDVMAELGGTNGDFDDDELLAELESMARPSVDVPPAVAIKSSAADEEAQARADAIALAARHQTEDEMRRLPKVPTATTSSTPRAKLQESV